MSLTSLNWKTAKPEKSGLRRTRDWTAVWTKSGELPPCCQGEVCKHGISCRETSERHHIKGRPHALLRSPHVKRTCAESTTEIRPLHTKLSRQQPTQRQSCRYPLFEHQSRQVSSILSPRIQARFRPMMPRALAGDTIGDGFPRKRSAYSPPAFFERKIGFVSQNIVASFSYCFCFAAFEGVRQVHTVPSR